MNILTNYYLVSCKFNNLQEVIRIVKNDYNFIYRMIYESMSREYYKEGFNIACRLGFYELSQWLYYNSYILNIEMGPNDLINVFSDSFIGGNDKLCKWMYSTIIEDNKNKSLSDTIIENAFINACQYNHFELAKWLYEIKKFNKETLDKAFDINDVNYEYINILNNTLTSVTSEYLSHDLYQKFTNSRNIRIDLNLVKWLYELRKNYKDFKEVNFRLFFKLIKRHNFEICEYLYNNDKYEDVEIYKNLIRQLNNKHTTYNKSIQMLDNLCNLNIYFGNCKEYIIKNFAMDFISIQSYHDYVPYYKLCYLLIDKGINFEIDRDIMNENSTLTKYKIARNILLEKSMGRIKIFDQLFPNLAK
jgi:hypothetical protein